VQRLEESKTVCDGARSKQDHVRYYLGYAHYLFRASIWPGHLKTSHQRAAPTRKVTPKRLCAVGCPVYLLLLPDYSLWMTRDLYLAHEMREASEVAFALSPCLKFVSDHPRPLSLRRLNRLGPFVLSRTQSPTAARRAASHGVILIVDPAFYDVVQVDSVFARPAMGFERQ
jgi:hypothetical protein